MFFFMLMQVTSNMSLVTCHLSLMVWFLLWNYHSVTSSLDGGAGMQQGGSLMLPGNRVKLALIDGNILERKNSKYTMHFDVFSTLMSMLHPSQVYYTGQSNGWRISSISHFLSSQSRPPVAHLWLAAQAHHRLGCSNPWLAFWAQLHYA